MGEAVSSVLVLASLRLSLIGLKCRYVIGVWIMFLFLHHLFYEELSKCP